MDKMGPRRRLQPSRGVADREGVYVSESTAARSAVCKDCGARIEKVGARGRLPERCASCKAAVARRRALPNGTYDVGPNRQYDRPDGQRECRLCGQVKPLDEFALRDRRRDTRRNECYVCHKAAVLGRYHADPERHRDRMRRTMYGLAPGEYDRMQVAQGGRCAICGERETSLHSSGKPRDLFVDHHHETGRVRELLCMRCNMGIGQFRDDPNLLVRAIEYLNKHRPE